MAYVIQPQGTFRGLVELRSPGWMRGDTTAPFFQIPFGVTADECAEAIGIACRMHLLDDPESPDDILPIKAADRGLPRYPLETPGAHRLRLADAWTSYPLSGSHTSIENEIDAAGYGPTLDVETWGGSAVTWGQTGDYTWGDHGSYLEFRSEERGPRGEPAPYVTQFWLNMKYHPVTGLPVAWGSFVWGDDVWGPAGLTRDFLRIVYAIVAKWKSVRYVFRGFRFRVGLELVWGDAAITWGDATAIWGGSIDATFFY